MGSCALSIAVGALVLVTGVPALAQSDSGNPCRGRTASGSPFATCFDPGNRLYTEVASDGVGLGINARHKVETDDPDVSWRLEHAMVRAALHGERITGSLYNGRFIRHSRDGHLLLPLSPPKKIFVPFDIGMEAEVGRLARTASDDEFSVGVIRAAILVEFLRSSDFRRRIAIGPVVRWDVSVRSDVSAIDAHRVTPFSTGLLDCYWESRSGLTRGQLRVQAGTSWSSTDQWRTEVDTEVALERVLIAINDRPLSLFARAGYTYSPTMMPADTGSVRTGWRATVGARLAWSWVDRSD